MLTSATPAANRRLAAALAAYWRAIAMVLATEHGWCLAHGAWYPGDGFEAHPAEADVTPPAAATT